MICVVVSARYLIDLGNMSDATLQDIAKRYRLKTTTRDDQIRTIRELLLGLTYEAMEPIVLGIRDIATGHQNGALVVSL